MPKSLDPYKKIKSAVKKIISGNYSINLKPTGKDKNYDELLELLNQMVVKINDDMGHFEKNRNGFTKFFDLMPLSVFETDDKGNVVFVNKTAFKTFGYTKTDLQNGLNALQMIVPDDRKRALLNMKKREKGEINESSEYTALTKKGKEFPVLLHSVSISINGKFVGFRGFLLDISIHKKAQSVLENSRSKMKKRVNEKTDELKKVVKLLEKKIKEQEKTEEALKESEERYKSLFERSFDGIYIHDFNGQFIDANDVVLKMMGYSSADITKLNFASFLTEDQYPKAMEDLKELKETGSQKEASCYRLKRKDGTFLWIETKSSVIYKNEKPIAIQGIARDITERMKTEKKLADNINYVENILMSMVDSLFVLDHEAKIKTINYSMLNLLGFTVNELFGQHISVILENDYYDNNNPDEKFQGFFKDLLDNEFIRNHEMYFKDHQGEIIPVNVSGSVIHDDSEEMLNVVCIAHDMRDVRNATAQLIQSEKLAALGQLIAGLAHELNQPLNNIMIIAQSIKRDLEKGRLSEEELENDLTEVVQHVNKMSSIINHTRIFSRDAGEEGKEFLDLNEVIRSSLKFINAQLKVHNFNVNLVLMDKLPEVKINSIQIEQVLLNFITNARFSVEKSGKTERKIDIRSYLKGDRVAVEICDNGDGIPDKIKNKIFQPFFTTKDKGQGTGLGLSVAIKIIESHNGIIEVDSEPGQGATFRIMFPIVPK